MAEQRLIDANAVEAGFKELCQSPYFKVDVNAKHGAETLMDLCVRTDSHKPNTIDPENLPLVCKLRDELENVTAERNAAVSDIETYMAYPNDNCRFCKNASCQSRNGTKPCLPKWRGPQKEE